MTALGFFLAVAWEEHGKTIVLGGAALGVLAGAGRGLYKVGRRIVAFGVRLEKSMTAVETQLLTNNGGSTLKDKIDAIDRRTLALEEWRVKQEGES